MTNTSPAAKKVRVSWVTISRECGMYRTADSLYVICDRKAFRNPKGRWLVKYEVATFGGVFFEPRFEYFPSLEAARAFVRAQYQH